MRAEGGATYIPHVVYNRRLRVKVHTWSIPSASRRRSRRWRSSYTAGFKLKVIETAEECGNRAAGREHSVSDWLALIRAYRF